MVGAVRAGGKAAAGGEGEDGGDAHGGLRPEQQTKWERLKNMTQANIIRPIQKVRL